jgi:predicted enzyme related to lactoylglutathione lyase
MQGLEGPYTILQRSGETDTAGLMQKPADMPGPSLWIPYLAVEDVDATVERANGLGATTLMPGMDVPDVGRIAVLADPAGALVGLFRPAAG